VVTISLKEKMLMDTVKDLELNKDEVQSLKYRIDLGLYYLKEWRLDDAEKVYKEMEDLNKDRPNKGYAGNGMLGRGMVLAFRDLPKDSNAYFTKVLQIPKGKAKDQAKAKDQPVVPQILRRPDVAEMTAKALNHNLRNSPSTFPPALRVYLAPPAAKVKGP